MTLVGVKAEKQEKQGHFPYFLSLDKVTSVQ
jgi:hypothetical protein